MGAKQTTTKFNTSKGTDVDHSSTLPSLGVSSAGTRPPAPKPSHKRLELYVLITFDVILFSLLVLLSVSLVRHVSNKRTTTTPGSRDGDGHPLLLEDAPFCLPCDEVYLTDHDVKKNIYKVTKRWDERENIMLCCGESNDDLSKMIERMYNPVHYLRDRARGLAPWKKADSELRDVFVSHLVLKPDPEASAEINGTVLVPLRPQTTPGRTETAAGSSGASNADNNNNTSSTVTRYAADVSNGSVKIQHTGLYYIYSHLPFKFRQRPSTSSPSSAKTLGSAASADEEPASQFVVRVRDGRELTLLENSVYPCVIGAPRSSCEYSFVAGSCLLQENDEISLKISRDACVDRGKEMNFGVHLM